MAWPESAWPEPAGGERRLADVYQAVEETDRLTQGLLLLGRERSDLLGEPALAGGAVGIQRGAAEGW